MGREFQSLAVRGKKLLTYRHRHTCNTSILIYFFFKYTTIHFHINRSILIRLVKRNQSSFPCIEMNKPLFTPVHSVSQTRFKFRSQFKLLPPIRYLITLKIQSSIISIDSNITDNIVRRSLMNSRKSVRKKCIARKGVR